MTDHTKISVDTLIDARWIVPVEPDHQVLEHHSLAVRNGRIVALLPTPEAHAGYAATRHFRLDHHVLIPGLINLHTHAPMALLRGLSDDLPLMEWLNGHIWPAEAKHVSPAFVHDGTMLACAEMIRGGVTCFNDMYFFPNAAAEAVLAAKMRAAIGMIALEFPTAYATDADDYLRKGLDFRDEYLGEGLITACLAPHAPYTVSDASFTAILTYAEQLNLNIHLHLHETQDEIAQSLEKYHARPIQRLRHLDLLGPNLIAVHTVHVNDEEIATLAAQGCHIAHCPTSNLKLASGIPPITRMLAKGLNIGLGSDGAASNNRLDLFGEMRLAALLAKGASGDASALPAHQALQMATLNGARALGLDELIGSLSVGKAADIAAVSLAELETAPCYDVVSHLVYAAGRENVSHVWCNGELLLDERRLTTLNSRDLAATAAVWQKKIKHDQG
jgi:5-methylthioadenosine/S-adenosylhomocysteine deaminase